MPLSNQDLNALYKEMEAADAAGDHGKVLELSNYLNSIKTKDSPQVYGSPVEKPMLMPQNTSGEGPPPFEPSASDADLNARGVDTITGSPVGNVRASFSPNIEGRISIYSRALSKEFNQHVPVTIDTKSGQLIYTNPKNGQVTKLPQGDLASGVRGGVPATLGSLLPTIGAILGSRGGTVGSVAGGTVGEAARLYTAHAIGADEEANTGQMTKDPVTGETSIGNTQYSQSQIRQDIGKALVSQSITAGGAKALANLPGLGRWIFRGSPPFNSKSGTEILNKAASSQKLVDDIKAMGGEDFNPTLAQMSGDLPAMRLQDQALKSGQGGTAIADQIATNKGELGKAFMGADTNTGMVFWSPGIDGQTVRSGANATIDKVKQLKISRDAAIKSQIDQGQSDLNDLFKSLPDTTQSQVMTSLNTPFQKTYKDLGDLSDKAYTKMADGLKSASPIPAQYWGQGKGADLYNSTKALRATLNSDLAAAQRGENKEILASLPNPVLTPDANLIKDLGLDIGQDTSTSVSSLNRYITFLRSLARSKGKGWTNPPDMATIKNLEGRAVEARDEFLSTTGQGDLLNSIKDAETARTTEGQFMRDNIAKNLFKKLPGGGFQVTQGGLLATLIRTGNTKVAQDVMDGVAGDAEAKDALNNFAGSYLKDKFIKDASGDVSLNPNTYDKMMRKQADVLKMFMTPESQEALTKGGDLLKSIHDNTTRLALTNKAFQQSFAGKISGLNAEGVNDLIFNPATNTGVDDVLKFKKLADGVGTTVPLQQASINKLKDLVVGVDRKSFDPGQLHDIVANTDKMNKLTAWLGKSYTDNLRKIDQAAGVADRTSEGFGALPGERNLRTDFIRAAWAGPLTKEGKLVTLLAGLKYRAFADNINKALTSPEDMQYFIKMSKMNELLNKGAAYATGGVNTATQGPDVWGNATKSRQDQVSK